MSAGHWCVSVAAPLVLRDGDRSRLEALTRSSSVRAGLAQRARIVLLAADGLPNAEIARQTGTSRPTVMGWRARYDQGGIAALADQPRSGRPPEIDEIAVVVATLADKGRPPERLGVTHWSARLLGAELGISFATVARIWRKWNLQPWRAPRLRSPTSSRGTPTRPRPRRVGRLGRKQQLDHRLPEPFTEVLEHVFVFPHPSTTTTAGVAR